MDGSAIPLERRGANGIARSADDDRDFERWFTGTVRGWGLFEDRFRRVRQRFTVTMTGTQEVDAFVLDENFVHADGLGQTRRWRVSRLNDGLYTASAEDIVGAAEGRPFAGGIAWRYVMRVPVGRRRVALDFDDRLYFRDDGRILNLSEARKWGILVGRLIAMFSRD
jgi:hypothetical protein